MQFENERLESIFDTRQSPSSDWNSCNCRSDVNRRLGGGGGRDFTMSSREETREKKRGAEKRRKGRAEESRKKDLASF